MKQRNYSIYFFNFGHSTNFFALYPVCRTCLRTNPSGKHCLIITLVRLFFESLHVLCLQLRSLARADVCPSHQMAENSFYIPGQGRQHRAETIENWPRYFELFWRFGRPELERHAVWMSTDIVRLLACSSDWMPAPAFSTSSAILIQQIDIVLFFFFPNASLCFYVYLGHALEHDGLDLLFGSQPSATVYSSPQALNPLPIWAYYGFTMCFQRNVRSNPF